jgi:hypothetical protein
MSKHLRYREQFSFVCIYEVNVKMKTAPSVTKLEKKEQFYGQRKNQTSEGFFA